MFYLFSAEEHFKTQHKETIRDINHKKNNINVYAHKHNSVEAICTAYTYIYSIYAT